MSDDRSCIGAEWRTLDDPVVLEAARTDPVGFLDSPRPLVIDEIQRAPESFLPLKARVDLDTRPATGPGLRLDHVGVDVHDLDAQVRF